MRVTISTDLSAWGDQAEESDQPTIDRAIRLLRQWADRDGVDLTVTNDGGAIGSLDDEEGRDWMESHWLAALDTALDED